MANLSDYALRLLQYMDLMLLFGLPLFAWYGVRQPLAIGDPWFPLPRHALCGGLLACAGLGLVLVSIEIVLKTAGIMEIGVTELDRASLAWYIFDTTAGRAGLVRMSLLVLLIAFLGWHLRRGEEHPFPVRLVTVLAGLALLSLAWNGHAAGGEGATGVLRLAAGVAHLLAAGAWIGAIAAFLIMLVLCSTSTKTQRLHVLWRSLHAFSRSGTVFVGILVVSGAFHYGDLTGWSAAPLLHSGHGNLMLIKLMLFVAMLGLAALHRWWLVPQLECEIHVGGGQYSVRRLRSSVTIEAIIAFLILISVAVLGTLAPR